MRKINIILFAKFLFLSFFFSSENKLHHIFLFLFLFLFHFNAIALFVNAICLIYFLGQILLILPFRVAKLSTKTDRLRFGLSKGRISRKPQGSRVFFPLVHFSLPEKLSFAFQIRNECRGVNSYYFQFEF